MAPFATSCTKREPDVSKCLTTPIGPEFSRCLVESPDCKYVIYVRSKNYCSHPNHRDFQLTSSHAHA